MRIGIDIRELEKDKMTGIGRYILNFLAYVSRYDEQNQYILFGNQKTSLPITGPNIRVKIIPEFCRLYWDQIVLLRQIKKEKLDLFFSPYHKCPICSSVKTIITVHDIYPFLIKEFDPLVKTILKKYYYKFMFYNADFIITVSEYIKKTMLEISKLDPNKIKVVYNSVSEIFRILDKKQCLEKVKKLCGIDKDFILYVGNLKPHKNLKRLIQAYNLLRSDIKEKYQLVIVAKKDRFFKELYQLVKDINLEQSVIFTDLVKDSDLVYLYNGASLYISISLYEGFGLPFVEAMACGTPLISANVSAIPEIVGDASILLNPLDIKQISQAIQMVLTDEFLRKEMINKGLRQAKNFSREEMANKILGIFKQLHG